MKLNNPQLLRHHALIDGEWLAADDGSTITVVFFVIILLIAFLQRRLITGSDK